MNYTIISPAFLPMVEYFIPMLKCQFVLYTDHFQYVKRSVINRAHPLLNRNLLTLPVKHDGRSPIAEKRIAQIESWQYNHLKTIRHTYRSFPFFEEYYADIIKIYLLKTDLLAEFLMRQLTFFLDKLKINLIIYPVSKMQSNHPLEDIILKFAKDKKLNCFQVLQKYHIDGWLNFDKLNNNIIDIKLIAKLKEHDLLNKSILDFIFQFGPEAPYKIREMMQSSYQLR